MNKDKWIRYDVTTPRIRYNMRQMWRKGDVVYYPQQPDSFYVVIGCWIAFDLDWHLNLTPLRGNPRHGRVCHVTNALEVRKYALGTNYKYDERIRTGLAIYALQTGDL